MSAQQHTRSGVVSPLSLLFLSIGVGLSSFGFLSFRFPFETELSVNTLQVTTDRASAYYEAGETITFIFSGTSGSVSYEIYYDKFTPMLKSGSVDISGSEARITYRLEEPGFVVCKAKQGTQTVFAAAAVSPYKITAFEAEPADFDAFWQRAKQELRQIPMDARLSPYSSDDYSTTYRISFAHVDNRRVYGYISIPKGQGPFPAILTLPPFGSAVNLVKPETELASKAGVIALTISIHNAEPDKQDANAYQPNDISIPEKNYDRQAILGCIRAIDYLFTRNDFNKKLGVVGVSQGGGLAMITAGLDERVNLLAFSTTTHAQHLGLKYNKASGFPNYLNQARVQNRGAAYEAAVAKASQYFDAVYFAKRYKGPVLNFINYLDDVTPPATEFAAFNQIRGMKILLHSTKLKHQHGNEYWNGRYDFFRRLFPETQHAPWPWTPTTTGYFIDAGEAVTVATGTPLSLSGTLFFNAQALNLPVKWEKLSGSGTVTFSNATTATTTATFSTPGTYVLRLTANDYSKLQTENKYYTLMDEVEITVTGSATLELNCPNNREVTIPEGGIFNVVDLDKPHAQTTCSQGQVQITQTAGPVSGDNVPAGTYTITYRATDGCGNTGECSFQLIITEEASSLKVHCPTNLTKTIPVGSTAIAVQWELPQVTSTCPHGEAVVTQTAGSPNGSSFSAGTHTITYRATDDCGNTAECSFTITLTQQTSISLTCPENLMVKISSGTPVRWDTPTVQSTCSQGQPQLTQTAGPTNGAALSPGTYTIRYSASDNCGNTATCSFTITVEEEPEGPCFPRGTQPWEEWISYLNFNKITHTSAKEGYGDFTDVVIPLVAGNNYRIRLKGQFSGAGRVEHWVVRIDFNGDGIFQPELETVLEKQSSAPPTGQQEVTVEEVIRIPATVQTGQVRMRVAMSRTGFTDPCSDFQYGEVEDYTIDFQQGTD